MTRSVHRGGRVSCKVISQLFSNTECYATTVVEASTAVDRRLNNRTNILFQQAHAKTGQRKNMHYRLTCHFTQQHSCAAGAEYSFNSRLKSHNSHRKFITELPRVAHMRFKYIHKHATEWIRYVRRTEEQLRTSLGNLDTMPVKSMFLRVYRPHDTVKVFDSC